MLATFEVTIERTRSHVVQIVGPGEESTVGQIPFTPRAKKVLELALRESLSLGHNYIGTEHILLGLMHENEGVAVRILLDFHVSSEKIRDEMLRMLSGLGASADVKPIGSNETWHSMDQAWFDGLGGVLNGLAREIRRELERAPDAGDLLLALACAPDTLAAKALRELGVDLERLPGVIERLRPEGVHAEEELAQRLEEVRQGKELAIESHQFQTAARLREEERDLRQQLQARADTIVAPAVLPEIRRHLGIPSRRTDDPPQLPQS